MKENGPKITVRKSVYSNGFYPFSATLNCSGCPDYRDNKCFGSNTEDGDPLSTPSTLAEVNFATVIQGGVRVSSGPSVSVPGDARTPEGQKIIFCQNPKIIESAGKKAQKKIKIKKKK